MGCHQKYEYTYIKRTRHPRTLQAFPLQSPPSAIQGLSLAPPNIFEYVEGLQEYSGDFLCSFDAD